MAIKQVIARLHPVSQTPMVFMVDTKKDSAIDAFIDNQIKRVGIEIYQHSIPLTRDDAAKVAKVFADHENIPFEDILVRSRLPKSNMKPEAPKRTRLTNDAALTLAHDNTKKGQQESSQDYRSKQEKEQSLADAAQSLHDGETKKEEQKASASNPEGAVVQKPRQKRAYRKSSEKEISARSRTALARFHKEVAQATAKSETVMQPAVPSPDVPQATVDEAKLTAALKLAKIILEAGIL